MYVWLSLNLSCCLFSGLVGWLCQLPFLFPGVPSMSNTPKIIFKLGGNLTEWHSTGLSPGSVPSLAFFLSNLLFSKKHVHSIFWALSFRACRIPPKVISNLGEISRNGIPLGSPLEVFPALHFSFLFLPSSFQQEACVYVWLSLVLSCFVHFLGWLGGCAKWHSTGLSPGSVPGFVSLAFFLSIFFHLLFSKKHVFMFCRLWSVGLCVANGQST